VFELQGDIHLKVSETNNLETALKIYLQSLGHEEANFGLHLKVGKCYDRKREYTKSIMHYRTALKLEPKSAQAVFRLGWSLFRDGQKAAGLEKMKEAVKLESQMPSNLTKLGEVLMREGGEDDLNEAIVHLSAALALEPNNADALVCLGRVFEK